MFILSKEQSLSSLKARKDCLGVSCDPKDHSSPSYEKWSVSLDTKFGNSLVKGYPAESESG